jgi:hypothetical protein
MRPMLRCGNAARVTLHPQVTVADRLACGFGVAECLGESLYLVEFCQALCGIETPRMLQVEPRRGIEPHVAARFRVANRAKYQVNQWL